MSRLPPYRKLNILKDKNEIEAGGGVLVSVNNNDQECIDRLKKLGLWKKVEDEISASSESTHSVLLPPRRTPKGSLVELLIWHSNPEDGGFAFYSIEGPSVKVMETTLTMLQLLKVTSVKPVDM